MSYGVQTVILILFLGKPSWGSLQVLKCLFLHAKQHVDILIQQFYFNPEMFCFVFSVENTPGNKIHANTI